MALSFDALRGDLERTWLPGERGPWPASSRASGERFAQAVTRWFAGASAAAVPCVSAAEGRDALASGARAAFESRTAREAGDRLAQAVAAYLTGKRFHLPTYTLGTSAPPAATPAAAAQLAATFSDLRLATRERAQRVAAACDALARSTQVVFPPPPPAPPPLTSPGTVPVT